MWKLIKKVPYWYLIAIPLLSLGLGIASNQAVLIANHDKFPVMVNEEKLQKYCAPAKEDAGFAAIIAKITGHKESDDKVIVAPDPYSCENGGEFIDNVHIIMTKKTHLNFLADVFDLGAIYSIGDFGIIFAEWMWEWAVIAWLVLVIRKFIEG